MAQLYPDLEYLHDYAERKTAELRRSETELCGTVNRSATLPKHI
jgi:hypothetical protein